MILSHLQTKSIRNPRTQKRGQATLWGMKQANSHRKYNGTIPEDLKGPLAYGYCRQAPSTRSLQLPEKDVAPGGLSFTIPARKMKEYLSHDGQKKFYKMCGSDGVLCGRVSVIGGGAESQKRQEKT